jgi:hypothetical protein
VAHRGTDVHLTPFLRTRGEKIFLFSKKINLPKYFSIVKQVMPKKRTKNKKTIPIDYKNLGNKIDNYTFVEVRWL